MYAGTTFRHQSGNIIGVHQRIDRVARRHVVKHIPEGSFFPSIKTILHFEGKNGPDGIKSKSPSVDEPWHFINPSAGEDDPLVLAIRDHVENLTTALRLKDEIRAGFEAAWLAHAITDGLTPAHHYPLAEKIEELWGKPHHERSSRRDKIIIKGSSKRDMLSKNWQYWGSSGIFNLHWLFEFGVASAITTSRFTDIGVTKEDLRVVEEKGYVAYFLKSVRDVDTLGMYESFERTGWSTRLGHMTRSQLAPIIMRNVCLAWYVAQKKALEEGEL
ncbi:hypothetical protein KI440_01750 [Candidatus Saccharibacteria bacterium TM7i]|nr:hypothetical protein KI440_01750 [Candidatus Saccharibacteria bacterium TM7i]